MTDTFEGVVKDHPLEEKLWRYVRKGTGCWEWFGGMRNKPGYGKISYRGGYLYAHRASWILANGPIAKGLDVCHKCDNPSCVRPSHLFIGTRKDNVRDCMRKGRDNHVNLKGEEHGMAVLDWDMVRSIRKSTASNRSLAVKFGVAPQTIQKVRKGVTWK